MELDRHVFASAELDSDEEQDEASWKPASQHYTKANKNNICSLKLGDSSRQLLVPMGFSGSEHGQSHVAGLGCIEHDHLRPSYSESH